MAWLQAHGGEATGLQAGQQPRRGAARLEADPPELDASLLQEPAIAAGSLGSLASRTTRPSPSMMQTALSLSATSMPA
jgi:hypothetical protein